MNIVQLRGGLTKDPDVRELEHGNLVQLSLAVNGTRYDRQQGGQVVKTLFVHCQAWSNVADELIGYQLAKGDEIYLTGELDQFKKDDDDRPHTRVTVFSFSVVRKRSAPPRQPQQADPWQQQTEEGAPF